MGPVTPVAPVAPVMPVNDVTYTVLSVPQQPQPLLLPPQPLLQQANKIKILSEIIEFTPLIKFVFKIFFVVKVGGTVRFIRARRLVVKNCFLPFAEPVV